MLFTADIGATNSRFALFSVRETEAGGLTLTLERERWLAGADFPSFTDALEALLSGEEPFLLPGGLIDSAVLALAGPVVEDVCRLSNLPWTIRKQDIAAALHTHRVFLINDFAAQGCACLAPEVLESAVIQSGSSEEHAPVAVIGAGTGLGKALLLPPDRFERLTATEASSIPGEEGHPHVRLLSRTRLMRAARSRVLASEGGHSDFPFTSGDEYDFAAFVRAATGKERVIGDMIVSGSGLGHLHAYLTGERLPDIQVPDAARTRPDVLCWFARFYGRACRNFILETLALNGLYITGGMALRLPVLSHPAFLEEFLHSAAHGALLAKVPVLHVRSHQTGLWGAALHAVLQGMKCPVSEERTP